MRSKLSFPVHFIAVVVFWLTSPLVIADSFRWRDAQGNAHLSDQLPKEAMVSGYDIVNRQGMVVRRIPASSTSEIVAPVVLVKTTDVAHAKMFRDYPTEEDLLAAQNRRRATLTSERDTLGTTLRWQEKSLEEHLAFIENYQLEKKEVPAEILDNVKKLNVALTIQAERVEKNKRSTDVLEVDLEKELAAYRAAAKP